MTPYHFDRSTDGQFIRAPDYQRNAAGGEGQVIARHHFVGHPPFSPEWWHGPVSDDGVTLDPFITQIASYLTGGDPLSGYRPAVDYESYVGSGSKRYLTWTLIGNEGAYLHQITCARHENGGVGGLAFENAGSGVVYEHLLTYKNDATRFEYIFQLNDDGSLLNANTGPYGGGDVMSPRDAVSYAVLGTSSWPKTGYHATSTTRTADVTATSAHFHNKQEAVDDATGSQTIALEYDFEVTLSDTWGLADIQQELRFLLSMVNLNNLGQKYDIEGDSNRTLDALGESVIVTHEGPQAPEGATLHPLRFVYTSNAKPWNWTSNGPCVVADNLNDVVFHAGEGGVDPAEPESEVNRGDWWEMMKTQVRLSSGPYVRTVKRYQLPAADSQGYAWPPPASNSDAGGEAQTPVNSALTGSGKLVSFAPGDFISLTRLAASPGGSTDSTDIFTDDELPSTDTVL